MSQENGGKKVNVFFIYGVIVLLVTILVLSFIPSYGVSISDSQLLLVGIIVVLLLFGYFDIIEIPGFLKLSKEIKELKNETKEIRQAQMSIMQAITVSQNATATSSIQIIHQAVNDARQEAETLLPELPSVSAANLASFMVTKNATVQIREHVKGRYYSAAFLDLRRYIDSLLRDIVGTTQPDSGFYDLLNVAKKSNLISVPLAESLLAVRRFANIVIHMNPAEERNISPEEVDQIVDLGLRVINELEKIKARPR